MIKAGITLYISNMKGFKRGNKDLQTILKAQGIRIREAISKTAILKHWSGWILRAHWDTTENPISADLSVWQIGKLWPWEKLTCLFLCSVWVKNRFILLNDQKKINILWDVITWNPISVSINKGLLKQLYSLVCVLFVAAFALQWQSIVVVTETGLQRLNYLLSSPLQKRFVDSWSVDLTASTSAK